MKNYCIKKLSLIIAGLSFSLCSCAQSNLPLYNFVKGKADTAFNNNKVPGIFIAYYNKDTGAYYTIGYAQPEQKRAFDLNTFFEIGSITKTFTAYTLLSVLRDHKINDTAAIFPYLPKEVQVNKNLAGISFLHLMNHTSGLPRLPENMEVADSDMQPYREYDSKKLFDYLSVVQPKRAGTYEYSNLAAGLAGVLAERIAGKTYAALLDQYIFLPFKMVDKNNTLEKSDNKSQGYFADTTKTDYWNMNVLAPAGGLKCTGQEMMRYLACMSHPINPSSKTLIDSLTKITLQLSPTVGVAKGWHTAQKKDKPVVYWHNGGTYGFSTFAAFVKETGQYVMVVINKFNSNAVSDKLGMAIINKMLE